MTRAETMAWPTDRVDEIYHTVCGLIPKTGIGRRPVRLLGISLSGLEIEDAERQYTLFEREESRKKRRGLDRAVDAISEKYGESTILPATLLEDKID